MKYNALITKIKHLAQAREDTSQDALEVVVENVAVHLDDGSRRDFASKLPEELQAAATMVPTAASLDDDIIERFLEIDEMDELKAREYVRAAWEAISELFDSESIKSIILQLPRKLATVLE